jgi:hypothetical protein
VRVQGEWLEKKGCSALPPYRIVDGLTSKKLLDSIRSPDPSLSIRLGLVGVELPRS